MQNDKNTINGRKTTTVVLDTPITRAGGEITQLQLMKPRTGDLRGLMLTELLQMKADTVATLLPRISVPTLTQADIDNMDAADLVSCSIEVAGFLVPKAAMDYQAA